MVDCLIWKANVSADSLVMVEQNGGRVGEKSTGDFRSPEKKKKTQNRKEKKERRRFSRLVWTQLRRSGVVNKQNDLYVGVACSVSLGLQVGA